MASTFVHAALAAVAAAPFLVAQPQIPPSSFEVASIKLDTSCGGRFRGMTGGPTRGRLNLDCVTLEDLIGYAFVIFGHGPKPGFRRVKILGGPAWVQSDRFTVAAKGENGASPSEMFGPMLRALLQERFQLKVHSEERESSVYLLTVSKSGLKLTPAPEGSCIAVDFDNMPPPPQAGAKPPNYCGRSSLRSGKVVVLEASGTTLFEFAGGPLANVLDRPVVDRTGLTASYDVHLEFAPDSGMPMYSTMSADAMAKMSAESDAPSIFAAFDKAGLKLEPGKAPVEVLVIDSVERLKEN